MQEIFDLDNLHLFPPSLASFPSIDLCNLLQYRIQLFSKSIQILYVNYSNALLTKKKLKKVYHSLHSIGKKHVTKLQKVKEQNIFLSNILLNFPHLYIRDFENKI